MEDLINLEIRVVLNKKRLDGVFIGVIDIMVKVILLLIGSIVVKLSSLKHWIHKIG